MLRLLLLLALLACPGLLLLIFVSCVHPRGTCGLGFDRRLPIRARRCRAGNAEEFLKAAAQERAWTANNVGISAFAGRSPLWLG